MLKKVCNDLVLRLEAETKEVPDGKKEIVLAWAKNGLECFKGDKPVCWLGYNCPIEIPLALGYLPFYPELAPGMLAGFNLSSGLAEMAETRFFNMFCCTFHRCSFGAASKGIWPKPAAILGLSNICDGQVKLLNLFGDMFGVKPLILETPLKIGEKDVNYLEQQLRDLIPPLEDSSGQQFTEEKLKETVRISNQTRKALLRIDELRKHSPSPYHGASAMNGLYVLVTQLWGMPQTLGLLENLIREIEENETKGISDGEKFRLILMVTTPTYKTEIYNLLEKKMKANFVVAELTNVVWEEIDEQNPFQGLARKLISHPIAGTVDKRVDWALTASRDYNVDGVIHFSHWGCRQTSGGVGVLREKLEGAGIPFMNLDVDLIDPRSFSWGQVSTRLEGFIEMLDQRKEL